VEVVETVLDAGGLGDCRELVGGEVVDLGEGREEGAAGWAALGLGDVA